MLGMLNLPVLPDGSGGRRIPFKGMPAGFSVNILTPAVKKGGVSAFDFGTIPRLGKKYSSELVQFREDVAETLTALVTLGFLSEKLGSVSVFNQNGSEFFSILVPAGRWCVVPKLFSFNYSASGTKYIVVHGVRDKKFFDVDSFFEYLRNELTVLKRNYGMTAEESVACYILKQNYPSFSSEYYMELFRTGVSTELMFGVLASGSFDLEDVKMFAGQPVSYLSSMIEAMVQDV
jgi:hypothetical protein